MAPVLLVLIALTAGSVYPEYIPLGQSTSGFVSREDDSFTMFSNTILDISDASANASIATFCEKLKQLQQAGMLSKTNCTQMFKTHVFRDVNMRMCDTLRFQTILSLFQLEYSNILRYLLQELKGVDQYVYGASGYISDDIHYEPISEHLLSAIFCLETVWRGQIKRGKKIINEILIFAVRKCDLDDHISRVKSIIKNICDIVCIGCLMVDVVRFSLDEYIRDIPESGATHNSLGGAPLDTVRRRLEFIQKNGIARINETSLSVAIHTFNSCFK